MESSWLNVSVTDEGDGGIVEVEGLRFDRLGVHRLTVTSGDGSLSGTSNPIRCRVEPDERIYWGDMHCHADYADATGTAEWNHDLRAEQGAVGLLQPDGPHLRDARVGRRGRSTARRC